MSERQYIRVLIFKNGEQIGDIDRSVGVGPDARTINKIAKKLCKKLGGDSYEASVWPQIYGENGEPK